MNKKKSILVIDDERVVCDSVNRILSREGFRVEQQTHPREGLAWAISRNYDLILLDLKMEEMDGIQLVHSLRKSKPDLPVIVVTGYPSIDTAVESFRMGISNYILKPFTPEEIIQSVRKAIPMEQAAAAVPEGVKFVPSAPPAPWTAASDRLVFDGFAWVQPGKEDTVRIGSLIPQLKKGMKIRGVRTAGLQEMVYAGFPLVELHFEQGQRTVVPSPLTGRVLSYNPDLMKKPAYLYRSGDIRSKWIAAIQATDLSEDLKHCQTRVVYVLTGAKKKAESITRPLKDLGCTPIPVKSLDRLLEDYPKTRPEGVVIVDGTSLSEQGPELVARLNTKLPGIRIIVVDRENSQLEKAYRRNRVFYYSHQSLFRQEASDIIDSVFSQLPAPREISSRESSFLPQLVNRIRITNRHGKTVTLLSFDDLLYNNRGPGYVLIQQLLQNAYPLEVTRGIRVTGKDDPSSNQKILQEKDQNDLLIVFYKKELGKIPGQLGKAEQTHTNSKGMTARILELAIEPDPSGTDPDEQFEPGFGRTLAGRLYLEMTSYKGSE